MMFFRPKKNPEGLTIVRRFSHDIVQKSPDDSLAQSLARHVDDEIERENQGERLFSESFNHSLAVSGNEQFELIDLNGFAPTDLEELNTISKQLEREWNTVAAELRKKMGRKLNQSQILRPRKLEQFVREAQEAVENKKLTRGGRLKEWLHKCAQGIYTHEHFFKMIPSENTYFSVLTGGLSAVVQASVEHESTADAVSDGLEKLSDQTYRISTATRSSGLNKYIKEQIVKFHSRLFRLLADILHEWLSSPLKRAKHSLGSRFRESIESAMATLERHVRNIHEESTTIVTTSTRDIQYQLGMQLQSLLVQMTSQHSSAEVKAFLPSRNQIQSNDPSTVPQLYHQGHNPSVNALSPQESSVPESPVYQSWTTQTIREHTLWMKRYTREQMTNIYIQQSYYSSIDRPLYHRLMKWATSSSSDAVWVQAPATMRKPSNNTLATACIISNFQKLQIPVISYFCHYDPKYYRSFTRTKELLSLVYALLYQISLVLPPDLSSSQIHVDDLRDLSSQRIRQLTADEQSLPGAIALLQDMLPFTPPFMACCIDGLQILDRQGESEWYKTQFQQFLGVLAAAKPSHPRILKTWIATDGVCLALQGAVNTGHFQIHRVDHENANEAFLLRNIAGNV